VTVTTVFMLLFGVNFNDLFHAVLLLAPQVRPRVQERRSCGAYLGVMGFFSIAVIAPGPDQCAPRCSRISSGTRIHHGALLRCRPIMTTTGYCDRPNFDTWPVFSRVHPDDWS
jgi:hypothetical protein